MVSWSQRVVKYLTVFGVLGLLTAASEAQAQNVESTPRNEPARQTQVLQGLESRNISDWGFASGGENRALLDEDAEPYELRTNSNTRVEEEIGPWDNTGDQEDTNISVDVYDF